VWLEENYLDKPRVSSVFIGFDKAVEFPQIPDAIWHQVWSLLTGLSDTELSDVATNPTGELAVFDPVSRQEVYLLVALINPQQAILWVYHECNHSFQCELAAEKILLLDLWTK